MIPTILKENVYFVATYSTKFGNTLDLSLFLLKKYVILVKGK